MKNLFLIITIFTLFVSVTHSSTALDTQEHSIVISISENKLYLMKNDTIEKTYIISTAKKGVGNISGSFQTPLGMHVIKQKIGKNVPLGGIIKKLKYTNKKAEIHTDKIYRDTDLLTSRVLRLAGEEKGVNKGGNVDSYSRGIMIHGTPEEGLLGTPASHGCIRMKNTDIIELFDLVKPGTKVLIKS